MRRWNGWGDEANHYPMPDGGQAFLEGKIGPGRILEDATLESVIAMVPPSRLPDDPGIDRSEEARIRHSRGQSLPDWLAMRSGAFGVFTDGVAFPETKEEIRRLLALGQREGWILILMAAAPRSPVISPRTSAIARCTISLARMASLIDLDTTSQLATFGPGTSGPEVEAQLKPHGYVLGHYPQSFELSTVGGWVVTRSSGQQSFRYGRIEQLFAGGTLETFAGPLEILTVPRPPLARICAR